jgi:hypothetical protein
MGIENISNETRLQIDEQLLAMAKINARMGVDSKADERIEARRQINLCLKRIKELDCEFWEQIVPDRKDKI